jgi:predicted Zn-dependent peptidase
LVILEYNNYEFEEELGNSFKDKSSVILLSPIYTDNIGNIEFICEMISNGLQSPLYKEIREKRGLSYSIGCSSIEIGNSNLIIIEVSTSNDKVDELLETLKNTLDDVNILTEERFNITKERLIVNKKKSEINRYNNVSKWISDTETIYDVIDSVTMDNLKNIYPNYFTFDKMYISIDKKEFNK